MYLKLHFHVSPRNVDFTDTENLFMSISRAWHQVPKKIFRILKYVLNSDTSKFFNIPNFEVSEFNTYQELLNKSNALLDKAQITRITNLLVSKPRVYVYGRGSSGLVAQEMKLRFMRIGLNIEAVTDSHIMKVNSVILDENCLVIGISVSGQTDDIISSLTAAHQRGAYTLLMTARQDKSYQEFCDETLIFASMEHLEYGNIISPQFPILLVLDVLYAHYLQIDRSKKEALHEYTIQTLQPHLIK